MTTNCRVTLNRATCAGIGLCEVTAPGVFEIGDDGLASVLEAEIDIARRAELEEAAMSCPTQSITVTIEDE
jgi:ferredoxin